VTKEEVVEKNAKPMMIVINFQRAMHVPMEVVKHHNLCIQLEENRSGILLVLIQSIRSKVSLDFHKCCSLFVCY